MLRQKVNAWYLALIGWIGTLLVGTQVMKLIIKGIELIFRSGPYHPRQMHVGCTAKTAIQNGPRKAQRGVLPGVRYTATAVTPAKHQSTTSIGCTRPCLKAAAYPSRAAFAAWQRVSSTFRQVVTKFSDFHHATGTGLLIQTSLGSWAGLGALRTKRSG